MKAYLLIIFFLFHLLVSAQNKKAIFNTKINNANKVEIKSPNGVIDIASAKNVFIGKVIITETLKSSVYLIEFDQTKDSLGLYNTIITFANPGHIKTSDININLKFNTPFESSKWQVLAETSSMFVVNESMSMDKKQYSFSVGEMIAKDGKFSITITSKQKPFVDIYGTSGALN